MEECIICKQSIQSRSVVTIGVKGSATINESSVLRRDNIVAEPGQHVHQECRMNYVNPNVIKRDLKRKTEGHEVNVNSMVVIRRSQDVPFDYGKSCLFCGQPDLFSGKKKEFELVKVRTKQFQESILNVCCERKDSWSDTVLAKIEFVQDLFAADAVYHQSCSINFRTNKGIPEQVRKRMLKDSEPESSKRPRGRPEDTETSEAFNYVVRYFESNDNEQITVKKLVDVMEGKLKNSGCAAYSAVYMKKKLKEHYNDRIIITEIQGMPNVVTMRTTATRILSDFNKIPKMTNDDENKLRLVTAAANLIKNDIKCIENTRATYPSVDEMASVGSCVEYLPESLRLFLRTLVVGLDKDCKIAALGQAIMQAARPRMITAPLQIGLATQMHHHFGSKFLIQTLHGLGFCSSYDEVRRFEENAAINSSNTQAESDVHASIQYVGDNVDHNTVTVDGRGTFHGMGIIKALNPRIKRRTLIPRMAVTSADLKAVSRVPIQFYGRNSNVLAKITFDTLSDLVLDDPTRNCELIWKIAMPLRTQTPAWSGFMQAIHKSEHAGPSSFIFLPMIDMDPNDMSCILSTLSFVCNDAKKHSVTPVVTFDQPLWIKATSIAEDPKFIDELHGLVLKLGGFHMQMSFLGSIGHLMEGSGLREVLELPYAINAVEHIISGKAYARAVRAHFLVDSALNIMLVAKCFGLTLEISAINESTGPYDQLDKELACSDDTECLEQCTPVVSVIKPLLTDTSLANNLETVAKLSEELLNGNITIDEACSNDVLKELNDQIKIFKEAISQQRTSKLWIMYMDMVDLLKRFIKAERTGNWELHLKSVEEMLPYFASSGHNQYAKCGRLYLQKMIQLKKDQPEVYQNFVNGHHVIRRSDRFWAGLSSDLVIEQVLMRSLKTTGGLTHGRGMTEKQRTIWLLSMPTCVDVNNAMQSVTGISYHTSDQHVGCSKPNIKRDDKDRRDILQFFQDRDPFCDECELHSIASGVVAGNNVNVDSAKFIGKNILDDMTGKSVSEYKFKKKCQAITLARKVSLIIDADVVQIDPQLLFQRLTIVSGRIEDDKYSIKTYELCTHPPSLFDSSGFLREANKPALADTLWSLIANESPCPPENVKHVIDGGSLLYRIPWPRETTIDCIIKLYTEYVKKRYRNATVVFDGYKDGPSTKDTTHIRRAKGRAGPAVYFNGSTIIKTKKELFLVNNRNKQNFIMLLSDALKKAGVITVHASEDADLLIVQTTLQNSLVQDTVLVGEDTDLLVLLLYHATRNGHNIWFCPETKKKRVWDIKNALVSLGDHVCSNILFVHAILGCDTTSHLFGIGKGVALKKVMNSEHFRSQAEVFGRRGSTKQQVEEAGMKSVVCIYNGASDDTLDNLRYRRFFEKTATATTTIHPRSLPPTSAAARYHSFRTYFQVQRWISECSDLVAEEWGWIERDGKLMPIYTDLPAAPASLLRIVRCNCKSGCGKSCSCRKHGLDCRIQCTHCKGVSCTNAQEVNCNADDDSEGEYS